MKRASKKFPPVLCCQPKLSSASELYEGICRAAGGGEGGMSGGIAQLLHPFRHLVSQELAEEPVP